MSIFKCLFIYYIHPGTSQNQPPPQPPPRRSHLKSDDGMPILPSIGDNSPGPQQAPHPQVDQRTTLGQDPLTAGVSRPATPSLGSTIISSGLDHVDVSNTVGICNQTWHG